MIRIIDVNVKYKILRRNHRRKSLETRVRVKSFKLQNLKSMIHILSKNNKLGFNKIKSFSFSKDIIERMKKHTNWGGKYFQITYLTKGLHSEYIKNSLNSKITNNPKRKWAGLEKTLQRNCIHGE